MLRDLRWAVRQFRRRPAISLIIVLSLGSAMGIASSLFSIVNAGWFKPWPVPDAHRLRVVSARITTEEWSVWRRETRDFAGLAADESGSFIHLGQQRVYTRRVSANYFEVLRVPMAIGRSLLPGDSANAVISYDFWQQRFAGDTSIIGRPITIQVNGDRGRTETVIVGGVASEAFHGLDVFQVDVWRPLSYADQSRSDASPTLTVFGRLAPGVSDQQAEAELAVITSRFRSQSQTPPAIQLLRTDRFSQSPPSFETGLRWAGLIGGLVFITAIGCANVANLMLASAYARRGEIALRLSLGAHRREIIRQLLFESLILSIAAGGLGLVIASWLPDATLGDLIRLGGVHIDFTVDANVLAWSMATSIVACFVFGLVPALRSTDFALGEALKEGPDNSRRALIPSLLSYQTIVSVMAIVVAGLMLRSTSVTQARVINTSLASLSVMRLDSLPDVKPAERQAFIAAMTERIRTMATGTGVAGMVERQWQPLAAQTLHVTPEYFKVLQIPLLAGRTFDQWDSRAATVVVNEAFARRLWPDRLALGQVLSRDDDRIQDRTLAGREVVGIVADAPLSSPVAYVAADAANIQVLLTRASRDRTAREAFALASRSGGIGVEVLSGRDWVSPAIGPALSAAWITTGFGLVSLLLGVVGFFSLLEFSVQQRTREIGIRRALGAGTSEIITFVVSHAVLPLARGLAIGSVGATLLATYLRLVQLPSGIDPLDPVAYGAVALLLAATAVAAAYAPTRRALRIEPVKALRVD